MPHRSRTDTKNITMHPPIDILVNLKNFIKKHVSLQNIIFENLPKNVIPIGPITRNFQYHHQLLESNIFKTLTINRYQLLIPQLFV
jgi:hypothetical protein